jgi:tetratricopeptide (TPR) repeat protein
MRVLSKLVIMALTAVVTMRPGMSAGVDDSNAIKAVLRNETMTFYQRDIAGWQATWAHDAQATRTLVADGSYSAAVGWDNIGPGVVKYLNANPKPITIELAVNNQTVRVSGDLAWVEYDQVMKTSGAPASTTRRSREHRALIRQAGQWKIVSQLTHDAETFGANTEATEASVNALGYRFLSSGKVAEAVEVLQLNVRLHADSWNAHDSLGEAYAKANNKELAIKSYERSLQLNPGNDSGKAALEQLRIGTP